MEEKNDFANMTVDRTAIDGEPAPTDSPDRELLIFGEGGGSFTKENGPSKFTKLKTRYIVLLVLAGMVLGAAAALGAVAVVSGGLSNLHWAKTMSEHDYSVIGDVLEYIDRYHFGDPIDEQKLIDSAAHGLVDAMDDPYAAYFTVKEHDEYSSSFNGNYVGIGIVVYNPDGTGALVHRVYEGSFAEEAGLLAGDLITAVDGVGVKDVSGTELVDRITGESGTTVDITFTRGGEEMTLTVTRGEVYVRRVEHMMLDDGIGYLNLTSFSGNAVNEFRDALDDLIANGAKSVAVDLRNNPGGSLSIVVDICDMLLPECVICSMQGKTTDPTKYFNSDAEMYDLPMCVIVNEHSASASEIFAGAMQDNGRAKIVGAKTYGKGVVQTTFPMEGEHGWIKLTTDAYYTPNGTNLGGMGVTPDVEVGLAEELDGLDPYDLIHDHIDEDAQLAAAVELLKAN